MSRPSPSAAPKRPALVSIAAAAQLREVRGLHAADVAPGKAWAVAEGILDRFLALPAAEIFALREELQTKLARGVGSRLALGLQLGLAVAVARDRNRPRPASGVLAPDLARVRHERFVRADRLGDDLENLVEDARCFARDASSAEIGALVTALRAELRKEHAHGRSWPRSTQLAVAFGVVLAVARGVGLEP